MGRISSVDAIILVLWLQMHVVVALNLCGNVIVTMLLWFFCKVYHSKTTKLVSVSKLRLLLHIFSILCLRLHLKKKTLWPISAKRPQK